MPGTVAHGGWQRSAKLRGTVATALVACVHIRCADVKRVKAGAAIPAASYRAADGKERALSTVVCRKTKPACHCNRCAARWDLRGANSEVVQARAAREPDCATRHAEAIQHKREAWQIYRIGSRWRPHSARRWPHSTGGVARDLPVSGDLQNKVLRARRCHARRAREAAWKSVVERRRAGRAGRRAGGRDEVKRTGCAR